MLQLATRVLGRTRYVGDPQSSANELAQLTSANYPLANTLSSGCMGSSWSSNCFDRATIQANISAEQAKIKVDTDALGWSADPNVVTILSVKQSDDPTAAMGARVALYERALAVANGQPDPGAPGPVIVPSPSNSGGLAPAVVSTHPVQSAPLIQTSPITSSVVNLPQATTSSPPATAATPTAAMPGIVSSSSSTVSNTSVPAPKPPATSVVAPKGTNWGLLLGTGVVLAGAAWMMARR
jgi:hypothetical protein